MQGYAMIKVDLHLHSKFSDRSAGFFSKKLDMHESYVTPLQIYDTLFERGMTHFTITDHDEIGGCLEIAHLPNTFISEEATAYFPEDRCHIHVLCYDITVEQHQMIQKLRYNVYNLVDYLQSENILHVFAHPLYDMDGRLNETHIERCLLMFDNWEATNGTRSGISSKLTTQIAQKFNGEALTLLEQKYGFNKRRRLHISFSSGSDDHGGMDVGKTYTAAPGDTLEELKSAFDKSTTIPQGDYGSPIRLTHMIMGISYNWAKTKNYGESYLLDYFFGKSKLSMLTKFLGMNKVIEQVKKISGMDAEISSENSHLLIHSFFKNLFPYLVRELSDRKNMDMEKLSMLLGQTVLSALPTIYYLSVYWQRSHEKKRSRQIYRALLGEKKDKTAKVGYFTDTFNEINGVALTSQKLLKHVQSNGYDVTFITSYNEIVDDPYRKNFEPIFSFSLPEYKEIPVNIPHFLDMLEYCDEQNFDVIYASTPGIVGLYAFVISKILHVPYVTTFHTDFPDYVGRYSNDHFFKAHVWNGFAMLFNSAELILCPSKEYKHKLVSHGVKKKKIELFSRGVNHERFNPKFRQRDFWKQFDEAYNDEKVILFVGRVAKEKNVDLFMQVYQLLRHRTDTKFVLVGDGPYMHEIDLPENKGVIKTGFLQGEELSRAYASADIFLFPSQTETFGNVVLEAQASGIIPIVSSSGGTKENLLDNLSGFVIDGNNPFDYAKAVEKILNSEATYNMMRENALLYVHDKGEAELLDIMLQKLSLGKVAKRVKDEEF